MSRHLRRRRQIPSTEIYDDDQQERIIKKLSTEAKNQSRFYRAVFSCVLAFPSPYFILSKQCRSQPFTSLICLVSLLISAYSLQKNRKKELKYVNIGLASVLALKFKLLFFFPLMASISALVVDKWLNDVGVELKRLENARYELRGV